MGKYKSDLNGVQDYTQYDLIRLIANELAEANRLKRLEMWWNLRHAPDKLNYNIEKDLKDQA